MDANKSSCTMYFTCKCLNVSIKAKNIELNNVNIDDIDSSIKEQAEALFNKNMCVVKDLDCIKNELPCLVQVRNVGAWTIHHCYNCSTDTHAVHQYGGGAPVLVNANIVTSEEEVNNLKVSTNYSPVFGIIIDHNKVQELELDPQTKIWQLPSVSHLPDSSRLALATLEQRLEQAIRQKAHTVDEQVREFTRKQYNTLDKFKERAHSEHNFLARLMCNKQSIANDPNYVTGALQTNQTKTTSINDLVDSTSNSVSRITAFRQHSPSSNKSLDSTVDISRGSEEKDTSNYDREPLFLLEGMDDGPLIRNSQGSDHESDTDDSSNEATTHVPRNQHRGGHPTLAKSLPVTVPVFPHFFSQRSAAAVQDDDDDQISRDPVDPHNIQASIKALAKSVHGDTVFGDLPRPRFSTRI